MTPIVDLHCDLLGCIAHGKDLHFDSPETNCSLPQLKAGNVACQVLAVSAVTGEGSSSIARSQVDLYKKLPTKNVPRFLFAIENASALVDEFEPLKLAFDRLDAYHNVCPILYVSLTWNHENRFGGGNNAVGIGLKPDGRALLDYLSGKNITIDLSHTSDALAEDILNHIERNSLKLTAIASHSNFRPVTGIARNMPDWLTKAIIAQNGIIGLNFIRRFIGDTPEDFLKHIDHCYKLGGEDALCFGADYYGGLNIDFPEKRYPVFQKDFGNASCYPKLVDLLKTTLSKEQVDKITHQNAYKFIDSLSTAH
ncbi:MAG: membrane dipeptidase [Simkaniaceae bacterium]|nr:membrane dipeptidase [Simkaniaceae bacterium]